jgi:hypothetical protein
MPTTMAMMMVMEDEQVCMECVLDGWMANGECIYRREKRGLYNKTRRERER